MMKWQILYMQKNIYVLCGVIITLFINKDILREAKLTSWNIFMQTHRVFFSHAFNTFCGFWERLLATAHVEKKDIKCRVFKCVV